MLLWNTADIARGGRVRHSIASHRQRPPLYIIGSGGRSPCWMLPSSLASIANSRRIAGGELRGLWKLTSMRITPVVVVIGRGEREQYWHLPEQDRVSFPFIAIRDGDFIPVGATGRKALRTPGHTFESTSYLLEL